MFAQLLPDIHFRLHFGHLYSPKHRFLPWYGVKPSPLGRAWRKQHRHTCYIFKTVPHRLTSSEVCLAVASCAVESALTYWVARRTATIVESRGLKPLSHAPEISAICLNSTPNFGASFSCRCTTSNVVDCLRFGAEFWSVCQILLSQTAERRPAKIYKRFGPGQTRKTDSNISSTRRRIFQSKKIQNLCLHF